MRRITIVIALFFVFSISFVLSAYPSEQLLISGCSVSYVGYLRELAEEYEKRTGVKVFVRGGGSVGGLENLKERSSDLAATCRGPIGDEGANTDFKQVAWDAVVFIVHKTNPLDNITLNNARDIFMGRITNFKQIGGKDGEIKLLIGRTVRGLQGVEASVRQMLLHGKEPVEGPNVKTFPTGGMVEQMIEKTPEGFAASGFTSARKRALKMLKVNGIYPTRDNIKSKKYPMQRPLFLVVPKNPPDKVKRFVDFALGQEGQKFISSLGAMPVSDIKR
jgi:phosphate transport system substrate-binding protein